MSLTLTTKQPKNKHQTLMSLPIWNITSKTKFKSLTTKDFPKSVMLNTSFCSPFFYNCWNCSEGSGFELPPRITLFGEKPRNLEERLLLLLSTWSEMERLVMVSTETAAAAAAALLVREVAVDWEAASTSFLERWRPLCKCLSQYLLFGTASLLHLHFFPSVRLHLPGSGSTPFLYCKFKAPHPRTGPKQN